MVSCITPSAVGIEGEVLELLIGQCVVIWTVCVIEELLIVTYLGTLKPDCKSVLECSLYSLCCFKLPRMDLNSKSLE